MAEQQSQAHLQIYNRMDENKRIWMLEVQTSAPFKCFGSTLRELCFKNSQNLNKLREYWFPADIMFQEILSYSYEGKK